MKVWSSELAHAYETYSFGYCNYATREPDDHLSDIYAMGFLPYSGKKDTKNIFYMARSARVDLKQFTPSSENRRIAKRFDDVLTRHETPIENFDTHDVSFISFCLAYFKERHGESVMPEERLRTILDMSLISHIVSYTKGNELVAYVFEVRDEKMSHFWFSFYDLNYAKQSLGLWLMLDSLREAKKASREYFYVGTVYGDKALYKANFPELEYWSGTKWLKDTPKLKERARSDQDRALSLADEWKQ